MNSDDEREELVKLISRIALEDRRAFRSLYQLTSPRLFGLLIKLVGDRQLAEDALQDTFVQLWKNAASYRQGVSEPMTWICSVARYRGIDLLRRRKNDDRNVALDSPAAQMDDAMSMFDSMTAVGGSVLSRCLDALEARQREAIVRCYCEGYSHAELSTGLNVPLGTVKSWIRRGLLALRECLER